MEKRIREGRKGRGTGLNALFWRYFITTGTLMAVLCTGWLILFNILVNMGVVMSAYTAARSLKETEQRLQEQETFDPKEIPHFYEWALVEDGRFIQTSMDEKQMEYARRALAGDSFPHGWPYSQYFHSVPLADGRFVLLEYDYSVCYADPKLQAVLPDFQTVYIGLLAVLLLGLTALCTRHFTKILRRDAEAVTDACEMVRNHQLERPLQGQARVKELQAALAVIDTLRQELAHSLKEQWTAEERKREALAALAHDLKTPLTVISGNAQLLAEDDLPEQQKEMAEAILRSADHAEHYVHRLREVTAEGVLTHGREKLSVRELLAICAGQGRDMAAGKGQELILAAPSADLSGEVVEVERSEVLRAVENLLSNAVRFTPAGGTVELGVELRPGQAGFWVQDGGPGFSPEALVKAGRTFYTEDGSRPADGHMGMGLYFAARVAREHGGELTIENTEKGGRVCLWLEK